MTHNRTVTCGRCRPSDQWEASSCSKGLSSHRPNLPPIFQPLPLGSLPGGHTHRITPTDLGNVPSNVPSWHSLVTFITAQSDQRLSLGWLWRCQISFWPSASSEIYGFISSLFCPPNALRSHSCNCIKFEARQPNGSVQAHTPCLSEQKLIWTAFKAELTKSNIKSGSAGNFRRKHDSITFLLRSVYLHPHQPPPARQHR